MINGKIEKNIGGESRLFWFNPNVLISLANYNGISNDKPDGVEETYKLIERGWLEQTRLIFYFALKNSKNKLPENYSIELVGEWIAEMDADDFQQVISVMSTSFSWGKLGEGNTEKKSL